MRQMSLSVSTDQLGPPRPTVWCASLWTDTEKRLQLCREVPLQTLIYKLLLTLQSQKLNLPHAREKVQR